MGSFVEGTMLLGTRSIQSGPLCMEMRPPRNHFLPHHRLHAQPSSWGGRWEHGDHKPRGRPEILLENSSCWSIVGLLSGVEDVCGMGSHITRRSADFHSLLINWNSAKHTLSAVIANHPQLPPPNNQPMPTRSKLHKASQYTRMV